MPRKLRTILLIAAIVVFAGSTSRLVWLYFQYAASDKAYEEVRQEALLEDVKEEASREGGDLPRVDFDMLAEINPDIIAWIFIPDSPVSYPILHGADNQEYVRKAFDGKYRLLGSIFIDYRNAKDFQDLNTIIYGHNTRDGSMFGDLKKYKNSEYAGAHKNIYILTKEAALVYEVFSVYETRSTSDTYTVQFRDEDAYADYLKKAFGQSVAAIGSAPGMENSLTLSTCTSSDKAMRLVVHAKFVDLIPVMLAP